MSEKDNTSRETSKEQAGPAEAAKAIVGKGVRVVLIVILLSLLWYLLSDRFTPHTSQARVQGYVVGIAPRAGGLVTDVWVKNNQAVEEGQALFQIDQSQYQIALEKARSDLETAYRQVEAGNATVQASRAKLLAVILGNPATWKEKLVASIAGRKAA